MKTLILSAFAVLALASCKKDYVCSCTNSSSLAGSVSTTSETTYVKTTKGVAKKSCFKTTQDHNTGGVSYTTTKDCKIK